MRTVAEHLAACLEIAQAAAPLDVVLPDAVGCVLAQDVAAGIDLPAVDLAGQDGYAVIAQDVAEADRHNPLVLDVVDAVRAGDMRPCHLVSGAAVLIDSGAPMPLGADAVIPWADTDRGESRVTIHRAVAAGDNVRRRAEDVKSGTTVLKRGSRISARHVALLAGLGMHRVRVRPAPRVVVVSIGDELVEPGQSREAGDVFDANGHALACAVTDAGGQAPADDEHVGVAGRGFAFQFRPRGHREPASPGAVEQIGGRDEAVGERRAASKVAFRRGCRHRELGRGHNRSLFRRGSRIPWAARSPIEGVCG